MRRAFALILILLVTAGCTASEQVALFTNEQYGYSVSYPSSWRVNSRSIAPPPPASTLFETDSVSIAIIVQEPGQSETEQQRLRSKGWKEDTISVAGETARIFSRPASDKTPGLWRRVYFVHNAHEFQISLDVYDSDQSEVGLKVFQDMLQSFKMIE